MISSKLKTNKWLLLTLLTTAVITLLVQLPLLKQPESANEDLRFFYWMYRFVDPSLFANDALLGYQFGQLDLGFTTLLFNKVSLLYGSLYALTSPFMSPILFSKLLAFPLALVSAYYLFNIAQRLANSFTAFLLTTFFILIAIVPYSSISLDGGLPRTFTLPLLLALLYYMMNNDYRGMALVMFVGPVYPPAYLTILMTYGLKFGLESIQARRLILNRKQLALFSAAFLLSILLMLPAVLTGLNTVPSEGENVQQLTVYASPLFGDYGRYPLLRPSPLIANGGILDGGLVGVYSLLLLIGLIPIALILRRRFRSLPAAFGYLVLAGLVGFAISWLAILLTPSAIFHMPSRYVRGTIFILSLLLFVLNTPAAIQIGARSLTRIRGNQQSNASASDGLTAEQPPKLISVILLLFLLIPFLIYNQGSTNYHQPNVETAELITFAKTLPQDTLIGGYPCLLDDVPLYAQRKITFSCETESRDMNMMNAALDAYFAETPISLLSFCQAYGVDYLVASPETFTDSFTSQERILFEPLNSVLKSQLATRTTFALANIPDSQKLFQNDSFFVVPCTAAALSG